MNRRSISEALSMIDDIYIEETMIYRSKETHHTPERILKMDKYPIRKRYAKKLLALGIASCLVLALVATAGAANLWGIRDMWESIGRELPEHANDNIIPQSETPHTDNWSCRITESLRDGNMLITTVTVSCSNEYILAPIDASVSDPAAVLGAETDETLGEYAAAQGKKLLFIGAALHDDALLIPSHEVLQYEQVTIGEMSILVQSEISSMAQHAVLTVYAVNENGDKEELELTFSLSDNPETSTAVFVPVDPDAVHGLIVGEAVVTETPLGTDICIEETVTDYDAFACMEMVCEELSGFEGGSVMNGDGVWHLNWSMGKGTLTDTLTIHVYDIETQQLIGDIVFKRK